MKSNKKHIFLLGIMCSTIAIYSQHNNSQFGIAIKTTIDINGIENRGKYSNFNVAVIGGYGQQVFNSDNIYPTMHFGFMMYNRGDLISSYEKSFWKSTVIDFVLDLTVNVGYGYEDISIESKIVPLYHFSDFTPNPLQNPFRSSFSLGKNIIWSPSDGRNEQPQRLGFLNFLFDRKLQFSTYNDGSFFKSIFLLGDGLDRYYTGGGMFAYHLDNDSDFNLIEFSFHKFTGHQKYAYNTATLLQMDFIPYKDSETFYYNKNRLRFSLSNTFQNYGIHLTAHNTDKDFQDQIHFTGNYSYHSDIFKDSPCICNEINRLGIGGYWSSNNTKF